MDEQPVHFAGGGRPAAAGLPRRVGNRDHHVAQEVAARARGEGEDVGRAVLAAEAAVERAHPPVAAEEHGDLDPGS